MTDENRRDTPEGADEHEHRTDAPRAIHGPPTIEHEDGRGHAHGEHGHHANREDQSGAHLAADHHTAGHHAAGSDPSGHDAADHGAHDKHAGHTPAMFRDRFWLSLVLTLPILYFSEQVQAWLGYEALGFTGSEWVNPVLGTVLFFYGGLVFLQGARHEIADRQPGMMTPISLAITVAYVYSMAVALGAPGMPFF